MIRPANPADAVWVAAIWNRAIEGTTATFTTRRKTDADVARMIAERGSAFIVLPEMAFATFGSFRPGPGYAHVAEHSIYVADGNTRGGHGRRLMAALETAARSAGMRILVGGISGDNTAAIAFHRSLGFTQTAHMPGVGQKWGRALDLVFMQKNLDDKSILSD